jgi:putative peptidoglycan binding protein
MIRATLRIRDGLSSGRVWLRSVVKNVQQALVEAGDATDADGKFGSGTEKSVKAFQKAQGLPETGIVDKPTWEALAPFLQTATAQRKALIAELLNSYEGDLGWVHEQEGHVGKPYWPKGISGITLDPGLDLGYADRALVKKLYQPMVSPAQWEAIEMAFGIKGDEAEAALKTIPDLRSIRIGSEQADEIMPYTAQPYWEGIAKRFSALAVPETLPSVQTVLLSLAYNRGINNKDLDQLRAPLDAGDWEDVANKVGAMQQDHALEGIRIRRRREADLIRAELEFIQT